MPPAVAAAVAVAAGSAVVAAVGCLVDRPVRRCSGQRPGRVYRPSQRTGKTNRADVLCGEDSFGVPL